MPKCKKHPATDLEIRTGKRNQNFVVCPECERVKKPKETKPDSKPAATAPAKDPEQKKNDHWFDRSIFG